ncbi:Carboxylic ester hydrolase [Mycena venus]|uniref:Carboxylic ester hydrolase n=1 Tax=Mycena venus TaxID=2733690 RepID=A0A8H6YJ60_9AGAR|nr:Carboxylic ester hydrolase [Mycena venus]
MAPSLPAAELAAVFVGCVLYGIYLVTLGIALRVIFTTKSGRKHRSEINWIVVAVSAILFVNSTLDLAVVFNTIVEAFLYTGPGGSEHVFKNGSGWETFVKSFCVGVQTLTGDAILIYRCWYIWSKSWRIVGLPMVLWLGTLGCEIGILSYLPRLGVGQINSGVIVPWGLAFWSLTISTNIITTSLIVWRIWGAQRKTKKYRSSPDFLPNQPESTLTRAMRNIVESGMIYTAASILELAAFATQSTLNYPASALAFHSVGITFNLIIIRGAANRSEESLEETQVHFSETPGASRNRRSAASRTHDKADVFVLSGLQKDSDGATLAPNFEEFATTRTGSAK